MAIGFIMWSMASFDKQNFAICGRTIEALRRNVIVHIPTWLEGMFEVTERRSENKMVVTIGNRSNTYYLFGGRGRIQLHPYSGHYSGRSPLRRGRAYAPLLRRAGYGALLGLRVEVLV